MCSIPKGIERITNETFLKRGEHPVASQKELKDEVYYFNGLLSRNA